MMYEKEERGEYTGWDNFYCRITEHQYGSYIYAYECRLSPLVEAVLEESLGSLNYWHRRNLLRKFDEWKDGWGDYPWYWGFEGIKEKRHGRIRTPKQATNALIACMKFVLAETKKDPNFQPPESFFKLMVKVKPLLDSVRPTVEARLKEKNKLSENTTLGGALAES